jgi:hypothetical protein
MLYLPYEYSCESLKIHFVGPSIDVVEAMSIPLCGSMLPRMALQVHSSHSAGTDSTDIPVPQLSRRDRSRSRC